MIIRTPSKNAERQQVRGSGLITVMVVIFIVTTLVVAATKLIGFQQKARRVGNLIQAQDDLVKIMSQRASRIGDLKQAGALPENIQLAECLSDHGLCKVRFVMCPVN